MTEIENLKELLRFALKNFSMNLSASQKYLYILIFVGNLIRKQILSFQEKKTLKFIFTNNDI